MAEPLKDQIDAKLLSRFSASVSEVDPGADIGQIEACAEALDALELKDRINLIADALARALSGDRRSQLRSVVKLSQAGFEGMAGWPIASFIERHCLCEPEEALTAMSRVTETFTCEFAVRPYLDQHLELTMKHVMAWTESESEHPRRLASEGTRPRLPWGPRVAALSQDPTIGLGVLDRLRHDGSDYVRRSVANHLNDIAKDHPDLVVRTANRWATETETDMSMIRHALRSLIKAGDAAAMEVLGFTSEPEVEVLDFEVTPPTVVLGESIELAAKLRSVAAVPQKLVVDFVIHHVLANGQTSAKVFKWATPTIDPGQILELQKTRKIATASTRRYHPGRHRVELQVAGASVASGVFDLPRGS